MQRTRKLDAALLAELAAAAGLRRPSGALDDLAAPPGSALAWGASDPSYYPASMIKTPIAAAVLMLAARGEVALEARRPVSPANLTPSDPESPFRAGERPSVRALLERTITHSDNVATNELIDLVGRERLNETLAPLRLPSTAVRRKLSGAEPLIDDPHATGVNAHPPEDAARLFRLIYERAFPGADELAAILGRQFWNDRLTLGLRAGDVFAHKTGETSEVTHDGGILQISGGGTFVLVVYTSLGPTDDLEEKFARFMRGLRPFLA